MQSTDYESFCERLYRQNEFSIKLGTDRIRAALDGEGSPDRTYDVVLVAGTNGKGSVASMLHAGLVGAGLRVGLFTSPHLVEPRERMRVDGVPISKADFVRLGREALDRWGESHIAVDRRLTFFELITLMACRHFAEQQIDIGVFEIGMGGRLDATNAMEPVLSAVTEVARDHEKHLGNTIEAIFAEKAGVLRRGRPAVVCRPDGWTAEQTRTATELREPRPMWTEGFEFGVADALFVDGVTIDDGWLALPGRHQRQNAACALAALELGRQTLGWPVGNPTAVARTLTRARWPGRWTELVIGDRPILLDSAHNPRGAQVAARYIADRFPDGVTVVMSALAGKDIERMLDSIVPVARRLVFAPLETHRALEPSVLVAAAQARGATCSEAESLDDAIEQAFRHSEPVVAVGSLYLVGAILRHAGQTAEDLAVLA